jgi:hypothetical protein
MTRKQEYMKERKRIQQAISQQKKSGYIVPENLLPDIPKRITKASINRLKKITPKTIRSKSELIDFTTGEIITKESSNYRKSVVKANKELVKLAKQKQKKEMFAIDETEDGLPIATFDVIEHIRNQIINLTKKDGTRPIEIEGRKQGLLKIFDDNVSYYDYNDSLDLYYNYLLEKENDISVQLDEIFEDSGDEKRIQNHFIELANLLNMGHPLSQIEAESISGEQEFYEP